MNVLAVSIAIILFPGIFAAIISDKITVHYPKWDSFKFGVYSFVLGTSCYILLQIITYGFDLLFSFYFSLDGYQWSNLYIWSIIKNGEAKPNVLETFQATLLSVPIAYLASYLINDKIFNKIAQTLHVSTKYGDENLFSYYLNSQEIEWIYVRDIEHNLTYQGRVDSYSENKNIQEIVLAEVTVFSYDESEEFYSIPSIYLSKNVGNFIIESLSTDLLEENNDEENIN